jgi:hypothetical protein
VNHYQDYLLGEGRAGAARPCRQPTGDQNTRASDEPRHPPSPRMLGISADRAQHWGVRSPLDPLPDQVKLPIGIRKCLL